MEADTGEEVVVCPRPHENLASFVVSREIHGHHTLGSQSRALREIVDRLPPLLNSKNPVPFSGLKTSDKIFASCWLDSSTVALGTKDNKFFVWNVLNNSHKSIPIPELGSPVPADACGIHDIDVSPDKSRVVTGGRSPNDMAVFSTETMSPLCILQGHKDWIFASKFVDNEYLVSASRDTTVSLWRVQDQGDPALITPLLTRREHSAKVRALEYHRSKKQVATLSVDGIIKIWDRSNMDVIASKVFPDLTETICMAVDETYDLLAIGHQLGVCMIDMREATKVMDIPSNNRNWGVRSVGFFHHLVTIGGGYGRLAFYDLRNKSFLYMPPFRRDYAKTGEGWVDAAESLLHPSIHDVRHAIYTHKFDPLGSHLLVAGGPIMLGMKGCYAALW